MNKKCVKKCLRIKPDYFTRFPQDIPTHTLQYLCDCYVIILITITLQPTSLQITVQFLGSLQITVQFLVSLQITIQFLVSLQIIVQFLVSLQITLQFLVSIACLL